jgi:hypothetical protein
VSPRDSLLLREGYAISVYILKHNLNEYFISYMSNAINGKL